MSILHVTGARPNFPKMAPLEKALRARHVDQFLVHTGQHFDANLSTSFFDQLSIPEPDVNLGVGAGSHATQTAAVMTAIEPIFEENRPGIVIVYGDVNSTVAATLVASKMGIRVAHVEAGLRSNDRSMPEELNRLIVDSVADMHFTTSLDASANLRREGVSEKRIHLVGNTMIDSLLLHQSSFSVPGWILLLGEDYALVTMHRPGNVDDEADADEIAEMLFALAVHMIVVFPIHPRTRRAMQDRGVTDHPRILVTEPMGYLDFMGTMSGSRVVVTDSGGVQEETSVLGVPCFTVRPNTERPVTIELGTNQLATRSDVVGRVRLELEHPMGRRSRIPLWDGNAGERIADVLVRIEDQG